MRARLSRPWQQWRLELAPEAPEALEPLMTLRRYLALSATIADKCIDSIVASCDGLGVFPHVGTAREDIRPGLRTSSFRKRVVDVYAVDDAKRPLP